MSSRQRYPVERARANVSVVGVVGVSGRLAATLRSWSRSYYALLERAGLRRVRFHDLRHSCASLLLAMGVEPRVVMDVLGHSQIAVTMNTYAHVMPALRRDAALRMSQAFGS